MPSSEVAVQSLVADASATCPARPPVGGVARRCSRRGRPWLPVLAASVLAGCQTIGIPGHPQSLDLAGEEVSVRFLELEELRADFASDWAAAFGPGTPLEPLVLEDAASNPEGLRSVSSLMALLVPLAADYITDRIDEEATRYEAQYAATQTVDDFWQRGPIGVRKDWTQRYLGLEITRRTTAHDPAVRIVLGLAPVAEKDRLKVAPLHVSVASSKAKVLDTTPWSFLPPLWWQFLLEAGQLVDVSLRLESRSSVVDQPPNADGGVARASTATLIETSSEPREVSLGHFDLSAPRPWRAREHGGEVGVIGTLPLPMVSTAARNDGTVLVAGVLGVSATVTERDPSNARKFLTKLSKSVKEQAARYVERHAAGAADRTPQSPAVAPDPTKVPGAPGAAAGGGSS